MDDLREHIERLVKSEHWDPFVLLGPHPVARDGGSATVVRAFLPEAGSAHLLVEGQNKQTFPMTVIHKAGLFEATLPERDAPYRYKLKVKERGGTVTERYDPYSFPPLLRDFDLHLLAEGRHYRAYHLMGARPANRTPATSSSVT